jgi:hypothetical protein
MTLDTTLMAHSMTKTFTTIASHAIWQHPLLRGASLA